MADTAYEFECNRAELLGLDKPNYEEFCKKYSCQKDVEEKELETEILKETDNENESLKGITGGLEELSGLLRNTQRKINNFKVSSITTFLKDKINRRGSTASTGSVNSETVEDQNTNCQQLGDSSNENLPREEAKPLSSNATSQFENKGFEDDKEEVDVSQRKSDLTKALDKHVDKLDKLINKAENCEISLSHQNKQMKDFIGK